jgi:hypothetical protein
MRTRTTNMVQTSRIGSTTLTYSGPDLPDIPHLISNARFQVLRTRLRTVATRKVMAN